MINLFFAGNVDPSMDLLKEIIPVEEFWAESYLTDPNSVLATKGVCIIFDIANFSWKLMKYATPHIIKMAVLKVQSLPIKDYKFHVVNDSFLVHSAIKIVWVFLPKFIQDSVRIMRHKIKSLLSLSILVT